MYDLLLIVLFDKPCKTVMCFFPLDFLLTAFCFLLQGLDWDTGEIRLLTEAELKERV